MVVLVARRWTPLLVAGVLVCVLLGLLPTTASARLRGQPACALSSTPGGDWVMYGHDLANARVQPAESTLPPRRVATLRPAWRYDTGNAADVVTFVDLDTTPVIARGCVFLADAGGDVAALDAMSGHRIWLRHVHAPVTGVDTGTFVGTPFVDGDRLILIVNESGGPYVIALDTATGAIRWKSPPVDAYPGAYSHASPIVDDGVVFVGFSAPEGDPRGQGGFALVDAGDGRILAKTYTVPQADWARGAGGGIWSTPAIDPASGYAFFGSGNPFSKQTEHEHTNAILKADIDRSRPTFGQIVASYKGEIDQALPLLKKLAQPTCSLIPENPPALVPLPPFVPDLNQARDSYACLQLDLDFGASANLFRARDGRLLVGELQKSGVYHVLHADDMARTRRVTLGISCLLCNGASTAYDESSRAVFAPVSPGATMMSFRPSDGALRWASPIGDAVHYQPPAVADGVAYSIDSNGFFDAWDARSGVPLMRRPLALDGAPDAVGALASGGVAVANHTVYVAAGSHLLAYRPLCPPGAPKAKLLAPPHRVLGARGRLPTRAEFCREPNSSRTDQTR
ncbi:MAG TPA: PQQ-binding-like beta-propeller repeat protein [Solirubrobacteraceae bacterium]|jgi:outer membrane protein assembly factor BamB